jgi:hypothetical protein
MGVGVPQNPREATKQNPLKQTPLQSAAAEKGEEGPGEN